MKTDNREEQSLQESIESGEWKPAKNRKSLLSELQQAAQQTQAKDFRMNVRISSRDVRALKAMAMEDEVPYQTLATSVIHKYVTGRLVEKKNSA